MTGQPHTQPTPAQIRARINDLINYLVGEGTPPALNTPAWWDASPEVQLASALWVAQAWILDHEPELDPETLGVSEAMPPFRVGPSHAELTRRRGEPVAPCAEPGCVFSVTVPRCVHHREPGPGTVRLAMTLDDVAVTYVRCGHPHCRAAVDLLGPPPPGTGSARCGAHGDHKPRRFG